MRLTLIYSTVTVCLLIVFSCATKGTKRGVQDNIFYSSSNPAINIKINSDFAYTGSEIQNQCVHERPKDDKNPIVQRGKGYSYDSTPNQNVFARKESHKFYNSELKRRIKIDISTITMSYVICLNYGRYTLVCFSEKSFPYSWKPERLGAEN